MTESELQEQIAKYIRMKYPSAMFHHDFGSGVKLTMGQAVRQKKLNGGLRAWPDLLIAEPAPRCVDGHIREQADVLERLEFRGYRAVFAVGFDEAVKVIDDYFQSVINYEEV